MGALLLKASPLTYSLWQVVFWDFETDFPTIKYWCMHPSENVQASSFPVFTSTCKILCAIATANLMAKMPSSLMFCSSLSNRIISPGNLFFFRLTKIGGEQTNKQKYYYYFDPCMVASSWNLSILRPACQNLLHEWIKGVVLLRLLAAHVLFWLLIKSYQSLFTDLRS